MNRQVSYIAYAFLLLVIAGISLRFLQTIHIAGSKRSTDQDVVKMIPENPDVQLSSQAARGKKIFQQQCASCHHVFKDMTGPALHGFTTRGPWADRQRLYEWIKNPAGFMQTDRYTRGLKDKFGSMMTAFPQITPEEIDAICEYVETAAKMRSLPIAAK